MADDANIRLSFKAINQHSILLTEDQVWHLAKQLEIADELDRETTTTSELLDAVWAVFERGEWQGNEALQELANDRTWVDTDEFEVTELEVVAGAKS